MKLENVFSNENYNQFQHDLDSYFEELSVKDLIDGEETKQYFKEFTGANNDNLNENLIKNICQYVVNLNEKILIKETLTEVQKKLLDLMKSEWNKKFFKFHLEFELLKAENEKNEKNEENIKTIITNIIKNVGLLNLKTDFEQAVSKTNTDHEYSIFFKRIKKILESNDNLMESIKTIINSEIFKSIDEDYMNNINIVINEWQQNLKVMLANVKENPDYNNILNILYSQKEESTGGGDTINQHPLLNACITGLNEAGKKEYVDEFLNGVSKMTDNITCINQKPKYSRLDLTDLYRRDNKTIVQIFEALNANENFKVNFYKIIEDILDDFLKLLDVLYVGLEKINKFNHVALYLIPHTHMYDYTLSIMEININREKHDYTVRDFLHKLEEKLVTTPYAESGTVQITLATRNRTKFHRVSLMFHKNKDDKFVFNYFDINAVMIENFSDLEKFLLKTLTARSMLKEDQIIIESLLEEYIRTPTAYPKSFHELIPHSKCDKEQCEDSESLEDSEFLYEHHNVIGKGICVLLNTFANFLWSIWIIQNPLLTFTEFLHQYNEIIYEKPYLYNTIVCKFVAIAIEKYNDENLVMMSNCKYKVEQEEQKKRLKRRKKKEEGEEEEKEEEEGEEEEDKIKEFSDAIKDEIEYELQQILKNNPDENKNIYFKKEKEWREMDRELSTLKKQSERNYTPEDILPTLYKRIEELEPKYKQTLIEVNKLQEIYEEQLRTHEEQLRDFWKTLPSRMNEIKDKVLNNLSSEDDIKLFRDKFMNPNNHAAQAAADAEAVKAAQAIAEARPAKTKAAIERAEARAKAREAARATAEAEAEAKEAALAEQRNKQINAIFKVESIQSAVEVAIDEKKVKIITEKLPSLIPNEISTLTIIEVADIVIEFTRIVEKLLLQLNDSNRNIYKSAVLAAEEAAEKAQEAAAARKATKEPAIRKIKKAVEKANQTVEAIKEAKQLMEKEELTGGGYAKYIKFSLSRDLLRIIQNIIILSIFKFARYTYYKKNIVNYGNESVYLLDYVMTLIVCIIFYLMGFEKISIGIYIDQLLSMVLYDKINDDKVLLLPYYLPFVLI